MPCSIAHFHGQASERPNRTQAFFLHSAKPVSSTPASSRYAGFQEILGKHLEGIKAEDGCAKPYYNVSVFGLVLYVNLVFSHGLA